MNEPKQQGKPLDISKRAVWDAWMKVRRTTERPGVDAVTIERVRRTS